MTLLALCCLLLLLLLAASVTRAIRPGLILQSHEDNFMYTPDPNALVVGETLYLFCSHDPANAGRALNYRGMKDYVLLTYTAENASWTNHGVILRPETQFPEALVHFKNKLMFAPGVIYDAESSDFYLYFPYLSEPGGSVRVAIAKTKTPHIAPSWTLAAAPGKNGLDLFDPAIFRDPMSNTTYIYGNTRMRGKRYNQAYVVAAELTPDLLAPREALRMVNRNYIYEAVFTFYRAGRYYLFARVDNALQYWILDSPLQHVPKNRPRGRVFTSTQLDSPPHASVVEFHSQWYIFYHTGAENAGNRWKRSACVDKLEFDDAGAIRPVKFTCKTKKRK